MNVKTGLPEGKKQETRLLDLEKTILEKQLYSYGNDYCAAGNFTEISFHGLIFQHTAPFLDRENKIWSSCQCCT